MTHWKPIVINKLKWYNWFPSKRKMNESKQKIVDGAKRLFSLYGFLRTTVDEVATNLKISKKTIYQYFRSKDELVEAVLDSITNPAFATVNEIIDSKLSFAESIKAIFNVLQSVFLQVTPAMFYDLRNSPSLWEKIDEKRRQVISRYGELIERGQKDGEIRADIDSKFMSNLIAYIVRYLATPQIIIELGINPADVANKLLSIFLTGILTEKGREMLKEVR